MEITSRYEGVVRNIRWSEGDMVQVRTVIIFHDCAFRSVPNCQVSIIGLHVLDTETKNNRRVAKHYFFNPYPSGHCMLYVSHSNSV